MLEEIKEICKKNPQIQKHIIEKVLPLNDNFDLDILKDVIEYFTENKNILKNNDFNMLNYNNLELAYDDMTLIVNNSKVKTFIKSQISLKDMELINDQTKELIKSFYDNGYNLNIIKDEIFKKIVKFKTSTSLNKAIINIIQNEKNAKNGILNKKEQIEKLNADVFFCDEEKNILIANIKDYQTSNKLGSNSWCISTSSSMWDSYLNRNSSDNKEFFDLNTIRYLNKKNLEYANYQFFIWDFNYTDKNSLIGFTYSSDLKKIAAHYRDDSTCEKSIFEYISKEKISSLIKEKQKKEILLKGEILENDIKKVLNINYPNENNEKISIKEKNAIKKISQIIFELDNSYFYEFIKNKNISKDDMFLSTIYFNVYSSKKILNHEILNNACKNWIYKDDIKKRFISSLKNGKNNFDFNYIKEGIKIIKNNDLINDNEEVEMINKSNIIYINKMTTIPIENNEIKKMVELYFDKVNLSIPIEFNNVFLKVLARSKKNNQMEWLKKIIKGNTKISAKIFSFQQCYNYLPEIFDLVEEFSFDKNLTNKNILNFLYFCNDLSRNKFHYETKDEKLSGESINKIINLFCDILDNPKKETNKENIIVNDKTIKVINNFINNVNREFINDDFIDKEKINDIKNKTNKLIELKTQKEVINRFLYKILKNEEVLRSDWDFIKQNNVLLDKIKNEVQLQVKNIDILKILIDEKQIKKEKKIVPKK